MTLNKNAILLLALTVPSTAFPLSSIEYLLDLEAPDPSFTFGTAAGFTSVSGLTNNIATTSGDPTITDAFYLNMNGAARLADLPTVPAFAPWLSPEVSGDTVFNTDGKGLGFGVSNLPEEFRDDIFNVSLAYLEAPDANVAADYLLNDHAPDAIEIMAFSSGGVSGELRVASWKNISTNGNGFFIEGHANALRGGTVVSMNGLMVQSVPEPSTYGLILGCGALILLFYRRQILSRAQG